MQWCSYTTYQEIAATGHTEVNGGTSGVHKKCSTCQATLSSSHSYSSKVETAATCTSKGSTKYTCSCGYSYTQQDIAITNHTAVEAYTYLDTAYHNVGTACSVCNTIITTSGTQMHRFWVNDDYCEDCGWNRPVTTPCTDNNKDNICDNCNSKVVYGIWTFKDEPSYTKDITQVVYFYTGSGLYCFGMKVWSDTYDTLVDYYEVFNNWSCWDNKCEGTWRSGNEMVNFGSQPQPVSNEFFNWINDNAIQDLTHQLSGKWKWNESLVFSGNYTQNIQFCLESTDSYTEFYSYNESITYRNGYETYVTVYNNQKWVDYEQYSIVDFGDDPQYVFGNVYEWFISNATPYEEPIVYALNGRWAFNEELTGDDYCFYETDAAFTFVGTGETYFKSFVRVEVENMGDSRFQFYFYDEDDDYGSTMRILNDGESWSDDAYRIIDFGNESQAVSQEFYEWFVENAQKIFNNTSSIPDIGTKYVTDDYTYLYSKYYDAWHVKVNDRTKTSYLSILESIYDKPVTMLDYTFYGCSKMQVSPQIPECIIDMNRTFYGCTSLIMSPIIPSNLTSLNSTFYGCSSLSTAPKIPDTVQNMDNTFYGCSLLKTYVGASATMTDGDFSGYILPNSLTSLYGTFALCESITLPPIIPSNVTNLNNTFSGCSSLTTAPVIPQSVTSMSDTFTKCSSLYTYVGASIGTVNGDFRNFVIPSKITSLYRTFAYCTSLKFSPTIPNNITKMEYTFQGCTSLIDAGLPTIPSNVTTISGIFQYCTSLVNAGNFNIPSSVKKISACFDGCTSLQTAPTIPSTVTEMMFVFRNCNSLTGVVEINCNLSGTYASGWYNFQNVDFSKQNLTLTGTSTLLDTFGATGKNYCTTCNGKCNQTHT